MEYDWRMRGWLITGLVALAGVSGACGGRLVESGSLGESGAGAGGSTSTGATASSGGASTGGATSSGGQGRGGSRSRGGASAGGALGTAGSIAIGGAPCACDPIACGSGFVPVPDPSGCCFHCECDRKSCPAVDCPPGSHLEAAPDQCCPLCVQDDCAQQQATYGNFKAQLLEKYAYGCSSSADCTVYYDNNNCGADCGSAVWVGALGNLQTNLQSYAQQTCSPSCAFPVPPCVPPQQPLCISGRCQ